MTPVHAGHSYLTPTFRRLAAVVATGAVVLLSVLGPGSADAAAPDPTTPTTAAAPASTTTTKVLEPLEVDDPAVTSGLAWHLDAIGARVAWRTSIGATVRVAVIDTGIDGTHPDLLGQVIDSVTCIDTGGAMARCEPGGTDESGHGTHVAGLIAARGDDKTGVVGVAPRARLLSVKALDGPCESGTCSPTGQASDLVAGIRWAVDNQADIINISVSSERRLAAGLIEAIREAWEAGAIIVLAAGSAEDEPVFFDTSGALIVTATDREGNLAPYAPSVDAARVALAAPGGREGDTEFTCHEGGTAVGVLSSYPLNAGDGSGYACLAGTSMAAAQVSGGLALLLSMGYPRDEAVDRIIRTARPAPGLRNGLVDLAAAVAGPYPPGVVNRHDDFATGVAPPPPSEVPVVGPFSVETLPSQRRTSVWIFMVGGALLLGVLAEVAMRISGRRHSSDDRSEESPADRGPDPVDEPIQPTS